MLVTRTSALIVGGSLLAAVIASPALMRTTPLRPPEPTRPFAADITPTHIEATRLPALVARRETPVQASRNPFAFATPRPAVVAPQPKPAMPAITIAPDAAPPRPPLVLSAIAEQAGDQGATIRTAILQVGGQVFLAKEGEHASPRFTIVRIGADAAEIRDEVAGTSFRLALR
jgi:hypothetical protein